MEYAFANSDINTIPKFALNLYDLRSMKGAFRGVTLNYPSNKNITFNAPLLKDANEAFAESKNVDANTNKIEFTININGYNLSKINAFSTDVSISLDLTDTFAEISALLPIINNSPTTAGNLRITGASDAAESYNTLIYTNKEDSPIVKWNNITSNRTRYAKTTTYSLTNIKSFINNK